MSLESAIPPYEEVFLCRSTNLSILPPCPFASLPNIIYTEIEGTGEMFGGAAGRIIWCPRTLYESCYKEREEDKGGF